MSIEPAKKTSDFSLMKWPLFILGWMSFVLGIIGAFLPILPTTPFLILSAFLFSRSSPRFHAWVMNIPVAGEAVRDWQQNRVINKKAKIMCTLMILVSFIIIWMNANIHLAIKIIVTTILTSVLAFVLTRKSEGK